MGTGQKLLIGCVVIPVVLVVAVASCGYVVMRQASTPGPAVTNDIIDRRSADLAILTPAEVATRLAGEATDRPLRLTLDLEEGSFRAERAATGEPLAVSGTFDNRVFGVEMAELQPSDGDSDLLVRFHRKGKAIFSFGGGPVSNDLRITIPAARPLDLFVRMRKGELDLDLTGLPLVGLTIDAQMGETRVSFDEPNPVPMRSLVVRGSMGNLELEGLGHADVRDIDFSGAMGNYVFGFDGMPRADATSRMRVKMGNVEIRMPRDLRYTVSRRAARFGNVEARPAPATEIDPELGALPPAIDFDLQASFGNVELY